MSPGAAVLHHEIFQSVKHKNENEEIADNKIKIQNIELIKVGLV
jgi:hypothetical protein